MKKVVVLLTMALMTFGCGDDGPKGAGGEGGTGGTGGVPQDCGDHVCTFTSATGSKIGLFTALFPIPLDLEADGSANVLCSGNSPDDNGVCSCQAEFVQVAPLPVPSLGTACLQPVPADTCPAGAIACLGGLDADIDLQVDHNLGITLDPTDPAVCTGNVEPPDPGCQTDCAAFCTAQGAVPAQAFCEGYCQISGEVCNTDDPDAVDPPEDAILCPDGDTCVGGDPVLHAGACQCQCLTVGDGTPDDAGDSQLFGGFGLDVLLNSSPGDVGDDGEPCTEDDDPSITIPPLCAPFTTTSASTLVSNAANVEGDTIPTGGIVTVEGAPFTCDAENVPTGIAGTNLRTAASFLDSALGDLAAAVELNCQ